MKRLTDKQKALFTDLAAQIANYRNLQAKAAELTENVSDYKSAELARYWQAVAGEALSEIEFWVQEAYISVPYRDSRNKAIDAFMALVIGGE
mgnify:FL=1